MRRYSGTDRSINRTYPGKPVAPIAEIRALPSASGKRRPFGLDAGKLKVPQSFYEPLPDEVIEAIGTTSRRLW